MARLLFNEARPWWQSDGQAYAGVAKIKDPMVVVSSASAIPIDFFIALLGCGDIAGSALDKTIIVNGLTMGGGNRRRDPIPNWQDPDQPGDAMARVIESLSASVCPRL